MIPPNESLPANVVNLLGQRFHASVGIFYVGLGMVLCNALRDWISNAGAPWPENSAHGKENGYGY